MRRSGLCLSVILAFCSRGQAQTVTNPKAFPRTGNPPVIFLNGFELDCGGASFQRNFGITDQVLQSNNRASYFFNTCSVPGSPSIETLGDAFGSFLGSITYADGQPVGTVDVVGYSMGGLVVRSYLSGKQEAAGVFNPPASIPIRKAVFFATPNFGSPVGALAFGASKQTDELSSGSHFLMDLNTWNQNRDDLRGIDAIAVIGNGGTGLATTPGFDDGLVPLSSGSLRFYAPGRTRILNLCHAASPSPITFGLCFPGSAGISKATSANDDNVRILVSFLNGSNDWQTIGEAAEQNKFLKSGGGVLVRARTAGDAVILPGSIRVAAAGGGAKDLNMSNSEIAYTDLINAGTARFSVNAGSQSFTEDVNVAAGGYRPVILKPGPAIDGVVPAAATMPALVVAPRMIVAIYGRNLATNAADTTVTMNGVALNLLYVSPEQINAVLPEQVPGFGKLTVANGAGSQTVNLVAEAAFPTIFLLQNGAAAAVNALAGTIVSPVNPLHAGDYVELFVTGLGATVRQNGFDFAVVPPTVTIGGVDCPVTYAGAAPTFSGLDQINCRVPGGLGGQASAPVTVRSGSRVSNVAGLAVQ